MQNGLQMFGASLCLHHQNSYPEHVSDYMPILVNVLRMFGPVCYTNGGQRYSANDIFGTMSNASEEMNNNISTCSANDLQSGEPTAARELDDVKPLCVVRSSF